VIWWWQTATCSGYISFFWLQWEFVHILRICKKEKSARSLNHKHQNQQLHLTVGKVVVAKHQPVTLPWNTCVHTGSPMAAKVTAIAAAPEWMKCVTTYWPTKANVTKEKISSAVCRKNRKETTKPIQQTDWQRQMWQRKRSHLLYAEKIERKQQNQDNKLTDKGKCDKGKDLICCMQKK